MTTPTASAKTLALRTGLHVDTVRSACARALVEPNAAGRYPVEEAERACRNSIDHAKVDGNMTSGRGNRTPALAEAFGPVDPLEGLDGAAPAAPAPVGAAPASISGTLASVKRDGERLKVERMQFDLDVKRGKMVDRAIARQTYADAIRRGTFRLLDTPRRAAPRLVGMTDPAAIETILDEEIRRCLAELASPDILTDEILGLR
ncbi:MAG: hypothetical protein ACRYGP_17470 [Janthinobacterium lividum]